MLASANLGQYSWRNEHAAASLKDSGQPGRLLPAGVDGAGEALSHSKAEEGGIVAWRGATPFDVLEGVAGIYRSFHLTTWLLDGLRQRLHLSPPYFGIPGRNARTSCLLLASIIMARQQTEPVF